MECGAIVDALYTSDFPVFRSLNAAWALIVEVKQVERRVWLISPKADVMNLWFGDDDAAKRSLTTPDSIDWENKTALQSGPGPRLRLPLPLLWGWWSPRFTDAFGNCIKKLNLISLLDQISIISEPFLKPFHNSINLYPLHQQSREGLTCLFTSVGVRQEHVLGVWMLLVPALDLQASHFQTSYKESCNSL